MVLGSDWHIKKTEESEYEVKYAFVWNSWVQVASSLLEMLALMVGRWCFSPKSGIGHSLLTMALFFFPNMVLKKHCRRVFVSIPLFLSKL